MWTRFARDDIQTGRWLKAGTYVLMPTDGGPRYQLVAGVATRPGTLHDVRVLLDGGRVLDLPEHTRVMLRRWEPPGQDAGGVDPAGYWTGGDPTAVDEAHRLHPQLSEPVLKAYASRVGRTRDEALADLLAAVADAVREEPEVAPELLEVRLAVQDARRAAEAAKQAADRRDEAIRAAMAARVSVDELMSETGLTRARIYQIRALEN